MPDKIVMHFGPGIFGQKSHKFFFGFFGSFTACKTYSCRNSENVSVHGYGVAAESDGVNHVGGFSAHARKSLQLLASGRNLSAETLDYSV